MLTKEDEKLLELYSDSEYDKPSVTVDAVIFRLKDKENNNYRKLAEKKLQVFLSKRNYSPYKDKYGVIGTFVDLKNELNKTLKLCVENKVKLSNFYYEQLFTFGEKNRDPRTRVLSVSYMILTNENSHIENGEWFDVDINTKTSKQIKDNGYNVVQEIEITLTNQNETLRNTIEVKIDKTNLEQNKEIVIQENSLAFDHALLIYYAIERLKNKLEYTDIIFNLLPQKFTLTELKNSYEVILNEKLLDANFRRKTSKMVRETDQFITGKGHRSSRLFTINPTYNIVDLD